MENQKSVKRISKVKISWIRNSRSLRKRKAVTTRWAFLTTVTCSTGRLVSVVRLNLRMPMPGCVCGWLSRRTTPWPPQRSGSTHPSTTGTLTKIQGFHASPVCRVRIGIPARSSKQVLHFTLQIYFQNVYFLLEIYYLVLDELVEMIRKP